MSPTPAANQATEPAAPRRVLVTAGPTREPLDAVRYISNRSSGRMGTAIARAAAELGCDTTLLLGEGCAEPDAHANLQVIRFTTTASLEGALATHMPDTRLLVMAAAVADFIPQPLAGEKVSRHDGPVQLTLTPAEDLLAGIAARRTPGQTLVGFALEAAGDLPDRALAKMQRKSVDAIVANPLETMDAATISATLMCADGRTFEAQPHMPKAAFARWLLDTLEQAFLA